MTIVRTKTKVTGGLTPEEKQLMAEHTKVWIARAFRTDPIEPDKIVPAIEGLYAAAKLKKPRVIIVPSPLAMAFTYGAASALWEKDKKNFTVPYLQSNVPSELPLEKQLATACFDVAGKKGLDYTKKWRDVYQGGNMWTGYTSYLTAYRDILGLELPEHKNYKFWEEATIHGGFRVMHEAFCIVSDFPELIKIDDRNLPHCDTGPSHRWRDGWSLYHWHGVRVPREWIENKKSLTAQVALGQENAELRRAACEIIGWDAILTQLNAKVIDEDGDPEIGTLVRVDLPDAPKEQFLRVLCGTKRQFAVPVPPEMKTALEAQAWLWALDEQTFIKPEIRT